MPRANHSAPNRPTGRLIRWIIFIWSSCEFSPTMMQLCWGRTTRAPWPETVLAVLLCLGTLHAASLDTLAAAYRKSTNERNHNALLAFANAHRNDQQGGLSLLALGMGEVDQKQYAAAVAHLAEAERRVPQLGDYAAAFRADAE